MTHLVLDGVTKRFDDVTAVDDLSLEVEEGETVVLLGPSGCGKTTCLRLVAGFERPDAGSIDLAGRTYASPTAFVPPEKRGISVVFQTYALWPHMSVEDNVGFGPTTAGDSGSEVRRRVLEALDLVQLGGLHDRFPHQLSGGQQQRVALARALVTQPSTLLLDEPLSNLDTRLREEMRFEVKRLQKLLGVTMVYVTHDQAEALSLADRVVIMNHGRIEQQGAPEHVYRRPRNRYVATALGSTNILAGTVLAADGAGGRVRLADGLVVDVDRGDLVPDATVEVSVRPADLHLRPGDASSTARVAESLFFGDAIQYAIEVDGLDQHIKITGPGGTRHEVGSPVEVVVDDDAAAVLNEETGPNGPQREST